MQTNPSSKRFILNFFFFTVILALPLNHYSIGILDLNFGNHGVVTTDLGSEASVKGLYQQSDGKIIVVGKNNGLIILLRYNSDGTLDTAFGANGKIITSYSSGDSKISFSIQSTGLSLGNNSSVNRYTSSGTFIETVNFPTGDFSAFGVDGKIATATLIPANGSCGFSSQLNKIIYSLYNLDGSTNSSSQFCSGGAGTTGITSIWGIVPSSTNSFYIGYTHRALNASNGRVREMVNNSFVQDVSVDIGQIGYSLVDLAKTESNGFVSLGYFLISRQLPSLQFYNSTSYPPQVPLFSKIHGNGKTAALQGNSFMLVLSEEFLYAGVENIGRFFGAATEQSSVYVQSDNKILVGGQMPSDNSYKNIGLVRYSSVYGGSAKISDFDNDAKSDISLWRPSTQVWYFRDSLSGSFNTFQYGVSGDLMVPADYDGDGKTDIAMFRPSNGTWYIFNSGSQTFTTFSWGANGDLPAPADHDGDGKADLVVFRQSNGTWYRRFSDNTFATTSFGVAGDKPVVGDFDGDGKADIGVFRPSNNNWYILKTGVGYFVQTWGEAGDIPVPADYDGDGKTDVSVWRPSTGQWFRIQSTAGFDTVNWGAVGDKPIPADYDGDGKSDVAVFRPSNGTWYIVGSTAGQIISAFGQNGDLPTQAAFIY